MSSSCSVSCPSPSSEIFDDSELNFLYRRWKGGSCKDLKDISFLLDKRRKNMFRAKLSLSSSDFEQEAETLLNEIIQDEPDCPLAYYHLGFLVEKSDSPKAEELYKKASEMGCGKATNELGCICYERSDYEQMMHYYHLGRIQGNGDSVFHLGRIYMEGINVEKDLQRAKEYFTEGAKLGNSMCYRGLGILSIEKREYERAGKYFKKAMKLAEESLSCNDDYYKDLEHDYVMNLRRYKEIY